MNRFEADLLVRIGKLIFRHFSIIWDELITGKADLVIRDGKFKLSRHSAISHSKFETSLSDIKRIISYLRDVK